MKILYYKSQKYGGFVAAPAQDVPVDSTSTVFSATNVQGVVEEMSDILDKKTLSCHVIKNICVGINPTTTNAALVVTYNDGTNDQTKYIDFTN